MVLPTLITSLATLLVAFTEECWLEHNFFCRNVLAKVGERRV